SAALAATRLHSAGPPAARRSTCDNAPVPSANAASRCTAHRRAAATARRGAAAPRFCWTVLPRAAARGRARRLPRTAALSATRCLRAGCSGNFRRLTHLLRRRHTHEVARQQIFFDLSPLLCRAFFLRANSPSHRAFVTR